MSTVYVSREVGYCRVDGSSLVQIIDLGIHPYADTFIGVSQLQLSEPLFPLVCMLCLDCGLVQLKYETKDFERYNLYDYSYTSSNSDFSRSHWNNFKSFAVESSEGPFNSVIEIVSNDGYLIAQFQNETTRVLGIDSSLEMVNLANSRGINTQHAVFDKNYSKHVINGFGSADLVIANNVLNHSNDPLDFVEGVRDILSENGRFIFEVPYWKETIASFHFDQIYHEHVTYFTARSVERLLKRAGFVIVDISLVNYHGGSLRVSAVKGHETSKSDALLSFLASEDDGGLLRIETYQNYEEKIREKRSRFLIKFNELITKNPKIPVVGIGAAAKANTLLTFYGLNNSYLKFITDSSPHKVGKFTPFTRIPICDDQEFEKYKRIYAIILSWNIGETLRSNIQSINREVEFIEL